MLSWTMLSSLHFTFALLTFICLYNLRYDVHQSSLDKRQLKRLGFSLEDLISGQWRKLLSSIFVTASPIGFFQSIVLCAIAVGGLELTIGSFQTLSLFLAIHLLTLVMMAGLIRSNLFPNTKGLMKARDVGPSAGYFGCLAILLGLQGTALFWISIVIFTSLCIRFLITAKQPQVQFQLFLSDLTHVLAYALGILVPVIESFSTL